ncbi:5-(carboxyamino)imidazole ribonucleotide synthase [Halolactibacillus halophilus]|uniref:N5-carboxyaminoimidazole ribonucleotide synthase n=1 Tax=Halolactibacillus halophilus TaxID=306540 RepID=A0A1I5QSF0_9BACI|nr:5-(carboxyamino)imidazole ribonucleotide synthase [Halolactibacillus halophilus]GEM01900.1 N5-carboxyaminoimidazole ribonucleotide synthase [Halolactibacillus halophilus]SFP49162.1 5-(carboxyamino)imidazole ribonucleotide synthase [Halolactibacillus halophilus]
MPANSLLYGKTIGIIGGGQLGRMMATVLRHMGYHLIVLDPTPDCPAAQLADEQIVAKYDDLEAIKQLREKTDVVTYEFENVDLAAARYLEAEGVLPQGAKSLEITQDREKEKQAMLDSHQPVSPFKIITSEAELDEAIQTIGLPAVVKTCRGGYDGKGQVKLKTSADLPGVRDLLERGERLIYEAFVNFDCEISVVFTRGMDKEMCYFPVGENVHRDHILHTTTVPASVSDTVIDKAKQAAREIAETIGVVGTFTLELFVKGEEIYVNELAPRPHNSGHYTIEACNVSQFEQHIRAIVGLPLLPIYFHGASQMINLLGDNLKQYFNHPERLTDVHIHMYGKSDIKPKRKVGHLTIVAESREALNQKIKVLHR